MSKLESRVATQEEEISKIKVELSEKDKIINNLKTQLEASVGVESENVSLEDRTFMESMRREIPLLSEGCARAEQKIAQLTTELQNHVANMDQNEAVSVGGSDQADQVSQINLAAMDNELKRVGGEINNINHRAKHRRRRAHLEADQRDQYSRRETLRVTGVPYKQGETTTQIMTQIAYNLGVYITDADISVSHRAGRRGGPGPRPILVKFVRRDVKNQILSNKRLARNIKTDPDGNPVRIFVDENLTKMRAGVCRKLRQDGVPHYTRDGKVYIATPSSDTEYTMYDSPEDWEKLQWIESVKTEVGVYPRD